MPWMKLNPRIDNLTWVDYKLFSRACYMNGRTADHALNELFYDEYGDECPSEYRKPIDSHKMELPQLFRKLDE